MNRSLTAVPGALAGHDTDEAAHTGATAVLFPEGAVASAFAPGSATGTRELGVLDPSHLAGRIDGLCLSGGSAFGLSVADGVLAVLQERGLGFETSFGRVPIVPAAILFDLHTATARPGPEHGRRAAESASAAPLPGGRVGAGAGARVGGACGDPAPGGFGGWAEACGDHHVGVGVAVNALGSVYDRARGAFVAGEPPGAELSPGTWREQTTLVAVATDAPLTHGQCHVLAKMASAGLARALIPAFTPFDGDIVFAASTGRTGATEPRGLLELGHTAAICVERAVLDAVRQG